MTMRDNISIGILCVFLIVFWVATVVTISRFAQEPRIQAIEEQVNALSIEVGAMERQLGKALFGNGGYVNGRNR